MRLNTGKAVFASLAIHAGVVAAVAHWWAVPASQPGGAGECLSVCLFSPPPGSEPLLPQEAAPGEAEDEPPTAPTGSEPPFEETFDQPQPAEPPQVRVIEPVPVENTVTPPLDPPRVSIPARVVQTSPPRPKAAPARKGSTPPNDGGDSRSRREAQGGGNVGAGSTATPPRLRYKAVPDYRETPQTRGSRHTVLLVIEVDERGGVAAVRIRRSCGHATLDAAAAAAARRYRFDPARAAGRAVPWTFEHAITFAP